MIEAERRPDRQDPFTDLEIGGASEAHHREVLGVDLEHREVAALVTADDLGDEYAPIAQTHVDLVGILDHVKVRNDIAVVGDDDPEPSGIAA